MPPAHGSLVQILWPVRGSNDLPSHEFDLGQREYAAIGYAVVHWAFLEEALFERTELFARRAKVKTPADAHDLSFNRRLGALRILIGTVVKDTRQRTWWNTLISKIGRENGVRQKIVHGLWSYDAKKPDRLFSRPRRSLGKWMTPFSDKKLLEFGGRVGELSFALLYPRPGVGRPAKSSGEFYTYASRAFLLELAGKADALGFPRPIRVSTTTPLTPSQELLLEKLKTIKN
jgi:hypothetical protein